jgi:hypothetical protein
MLPESLLLLQLMAEHRREKKAEAKLALQQANLTIMPSLALLALGELALINCPY